MTFTADGTENRMRWDRSTPGFMEAWYATVHHRPTGCGLWFRYTITAPLSGSPYCELWGFVFDPSDKHSFAQKQRYQIDRLGAPNGRDDGALVRIGDAWLSENHLEGSLSSDGTRTLAWSLDFEPADRCLQHLPAPLRRRAERRVSTICSPNLSVPFSGSVTVGDQVLGFDGDPGCQSHRWGRRHAPSWAWAHCSLFAEEEAVFEGLAARAPLGPLPAPTLPFLYLNVRGEDLAFNDVKSALRAKTNYEMPTWSFTAHNEGFKIVGAARTPLDRLVQVHYVDPDGTSRYCANTEIADMAIEVYGKSGATWRHLASLTALRTADLEFGRREPFVEVPVAF